MIIYMNAMHFLDLLGLVMVGSGWSLPMPRYQQLHQPRWPINPCWPRWPRFRTMTSRGAQEPSPAPGWLVVLAPLKNMKVRLCQIGSSSQLLGKIKNVANHQPAPGLLVLFSQKALVCCRHWSHWNARCLRNRWLRKTSETQRSATW